LQEEFEEQFNPSLLPMPPKTDKQVVAADKEPVKEVVPVVEPIKEPVKEADEDEC